VAEAASSSAEAALENQTSGLADPRPVLLLCTLAQNLRRELGRYCGTIGITRPRAERPLWVDSGYRPCASASIATPELGRAKTPPLRSSQGTGPTSAERLSA